MWITISYILKIFIIFFMISRFDSSGRLNCYYDIAAVFIFSCISAIFMIQ